MAATAIPRTGMSSLTYIPPAATKAIMLMSKPTTFFMFFTLISCRAQLLISAYSKSFSASAGSLALGKKATKKARTPILS